MANKNFEVKHGLSVGGTERISSAGVGTFTDLNVTGTTTTIDTATLQVQDKNIVINYGTGDTSSTANGAGITIQDAVDASNDATLLWDNSNDRFDFSHTVRAPSLKSTGAATFDSTFTSTGLLLNVNTSLFNQDAAISYYSASNGVYVNGAGTNGWLRLNASGAENARNSIDLYGQNGGDYIKIKAANTDTLYVGANGAGSVGIGTSSPTSYGGGNFEFKDTSTNQTGVRVSAATKSAEIGVDNAGGYLQTVTDGGGWTFYTSNGGIANTTAMKILSNGNVGVGVTNPGYKFMVNSKLTVGDAPGVGLSGNTIHVRENSSSGIHFPLVIGGGTHVAGAAFGIGLDPEGYGNRNKIAILAEGNGAGYSRGKLHFAIEGSNNSDQADLTDSRMCIQEDGKVGIGTTSPAGLLTIKGSGDAIRIESTNSGDGGAQMDMLHFSSSPADNDVHATINMGGYYSGSSSAYGSSIKSIWSDVSAKEAKLEFYTRDDSTFTHKMAINHTGDVHFNYLSSDFRLRGGVYGSLFDSSPNMNHNIRYNASAGMYFNTGTTNGSFVFEQRGTARFTIDGSGGSNGSDIKLKENVEDITYGLDTVKQLQPRKFDWKGEDIPEDEKAGIGFIAQEVESIIPELISEKDHPDDPGDGSKNTKMMNYGAMTSVLVKAIQELEARVKELEG